MYQTVVVRRLDLHIAIPISDCHRAANVLAAAIAQFGPDDPVRLILTPDDDTQPTAEHAGALVAMFGEFEAKLGPLPQIQLIPAAQLLGGSTALSIRATGEPAADARAVGVLTAFGRRLGNTLGAHPQHADTPRGGFRLARAEAKAALAKRELFRPRPAGAPVRIAVFLWTPNFWPVVESFVRAARTRDDVQVEVVCPDRDTSGVRRSPKEGELAEFFGRDGVQPRDNTWLANNLADMDIVVTPDPYDPLRPAGLRARDLAEAGIRLVYFPYAQALSAEPANIQKLYNLPLQNIAWRIYAPSQGQLDNYGRYCESGNSHVRYLGSIKNERLLTSESGAEAAAAIRARLATKTVMLWNPHWTIYEGGWSTFGKNMAPIMEYFIQHPKRGLIVRPHPGLLLDWERRSGSGGPALVAEFRQLCERLPNVYLDEDFDHVPAMLASDAMISDLSSVIPEYLCLNRPLGYLRQNGSELNPDQAWLKNAVQIADKRRLITFLDRPMRPPGATQAPNEHGSAERIVTAMITDFWAETSLGAPTQAKAA